MMIIGARGHTPGNYQIRLMIYEQGMRQWSSSETVKLWTGLGLSTLQSMSSSCRDKLSQAVTAQSTQSHLAALAVDQVQCASCKSRGAG